MECLFVSKRSNMEEESQSSLELMYVPSQLTEVTDGQVDSLPLI